MEAKWKVDLNFVEEGDIYFFYKPKRSIDKPRGLDDVARFFFVFQPVGDANPRYIVMGNKKMPTINDGGDTNWGFVQMVGGRGFESLSGGYSRKGASRPVGEGIYAIIGHRDHTHLLYTLELPTFQGPVQRAFNIEKQADYIILERPIELTPKTAETPFSNFMPVKNPNNLNYRGTEILLVGVSADIGRMGIRVEKDRETILTADIFRRLKVDKSRHPTASLISGNWE